MSPQDRTHSILLVDDDADSLRLYRQALEVFGWTLHAADNERDALIAARRDRPDAILLDVGIPGTDGARVLTRLRRDYRTRRIPVIALTSVSEWLQFHRRGDVTSRFDSVIFRPVQNDMLIRRILEVMTGPGTDPSRPRHNISEGW
jgi:CheY-like chemotaxis protein